MCMVFIKQRIYILTVCSAISISVVVRIFDVDVDVGMLYLVDLAGCHKRRKTNVSETQLKECQQVNVTLAALQDTLQQIKRKSKLLPIRNSKLTMLVNSAFGQFVLFFFSFKTFPTEFKGFSHFSKNCLDFKIFYRYLFYERKCSKLSF